MSTITILEPYDTQMYDYGADIDVPMNASTETWLTGTPMDDDSISFMKTTQPLSTMEVEMETYEGTFEEYEMGDDQADDKENYSPLPIDHSDVEVLDASRVPTPRPNLNLELDSENPQVATETNPQVFTPLVDPSATSPDGVLDVLPLQLTLSNPEPTLILSPQVEYHEAFQHHTEEPLADQSVVSEAPDEHSWEETTPEHSTLATADRLDSQPTDAAASKTATEEDDSSAHAEVVYPSHSPDLAWPHSHEAEQEEHAVADPHEISEGVYIDPPPAVLLSLPSCTSEEPEFSLFNQPAASGASHPSLALTLFLHHRPTLYYEPLAQLFEALRQDAEFVARVPDAVEGELILDAYDLQLVILEDNLYAREVTLHDINVIHDGTGLSGPLRIQVGTVNPRFITRYRFLQEQIARMTLAAEIEGAQTHEALSHQEPETVAENEEHQPGHDPHHDLAAAETEHFPEEDHAPQAETYVEDGTEGGKHQDVSRHQEDAEEEDPKPSHEDAPVHSTEEYEEYEDDDGTEATHEHEGSNADESGNADEDASDTATLTGDSRSVPTSAEEPRDPNGFDPGAERAPSQTQGGKEAEDEEEYQEYSEAHADHEDEPKIDVLVQDSAPEAQEGAERDGEELHYEDDGHYEFAHYDEEVPGNDGSAFPNAEFENEEDWNDPQVNTHSTADVIGIRNTEHDAAAPKLLNLELQTPNVDESDLNFVAMLEREADLHNPDASTPTPTDDFVHPENYFEHPELIFDDDEWSAGVEGDYETLGLVGDGEALSNESSVTLSSTKTSKRTYDEVEEDVRDEESPASSPGPKRYRVDA